MSKRRRGRRSGRRHAPQMRVEPFTPPGTLTADPGALPTRIALMAYGPEGHVEKEIHDPAELREHLGRWPVLWVDVDGLADTGLIQAIGDLFHLHRLALEDVVHLRQRPKVEEYGDNLYLVMRMTECREMLDIEQFSLFLGRGFVVTFQEDVGDVLDMVRGRIRSGAGRLRALGADHLAHAILDALIDGHFPVLERYGDLLESLEDQILEQPRRNLIGEIHQVKRDLLEIRRAIWPMRDALSALLRDESALITPETRFYLRDTYDHIIQLIDLEETQRELVASLTDLHLSNVSTRLNEVMKLLTIIATIFMPLSWIAGIYGMNFVHMPGLGWRWGFTAALLVMAFTAGGMVTLFWRRGWLSPGSRQLRESAKREEGVP